MVSTFPSRARRTALVLRDTLIIAALYAGAAQVAYQAAVVHGNACPVWPATAVALVAVLLRGRAALPGLALGIAVSSAGRLPLAALLVLVVANVLEPMLDVWVLRRFRGDPRLVTVRDVCVFLVAVTAGAGISAIGGISALALAGFIDGGDALQTGALWAMGNVLGAACAAPVVLVARGRGHASGAETAVLFAVAGGVGLVALSGTDTQIYGLFPVLMWAGLRLSPRGAAGITLMLSAFTVTFTARGDGPFVGETATSSLLTSQGFIFVLALTTLLLAAVTEDRRRAGRDLEASEHEKQGMADEQAALRRVATAVAESHPRAEVLALVAREVAGLAGVEAGTVVRHIDDRTVRIVGQWGLSHRDGEVGRTIALASDGPVREAREGGGPARSEELFGGDAPTPFRQRVAAPVQVDGRFWGAILASTSSTEALPPDTEERLGRFAELVALAISNAEQQERLTAQATSDPLTGLLNHRAFHERLREEVERAARHDRELSVAVFDIDHFKQINDTLGHGAGDQVLQLAAQRLRRAARRGEPVGRVGGDELAVIMPEVGGLEAFVAADRLRAAISTSPYPQAGTISASAGTCDLEQAGDAEALLRLADGALYWAKAHGRDICFRYTPDVVAELSATERAERLSRSQALSGIRALARAIDAKDRSTTQHSERVAELAARLARERGWDAGSVARLREAGLVHDVGKIGVPDAVLFKPGRLSEGERVAVQRHAELGAQIASEVLDAEQVSWILAHHEHVDGGGYPHGLGAPAIPEGARLLALADAWDAMTRARPYSSPMTPEAAFRECRRQAGKQFCPVALRALEELWEAGRLDIELAPTPGALR